MHKKDKMIDIRHIKCIETGCNTQPTFNYEFESKGIYCKTHKKPGMINVKHIKCNYLNCNKRPNFNYSNENKGIYCFGHKLPTMIDVMTPKCNHLGCRILIFNFPNETRGLYCLKHKKENMIDVRNAKCNIKNCNIQPIFNFKNQDKGKFCLKHKHPDMIDVVNPTCIDCDRQAHYSSPGITPIKCSKHVTDGMISNPRKRCINECKEYAIYGITVPVRCEMHKESTDENLILRTCVNCKSLEICNVNGLCFEYCINNELFKRYKHKKEIHIIRLFSNFIDTPMYSIDMPIDTSCNLMQP